MEASSEARLRALLGDADETVAADWAEGYGVVSPDVARYVEVLRGVPDPVVLAMRNVAAEEGLGLLDADTCTALALLTRAKLPEHLLELGTGLGYLTVHLARAAPVDCTLTSIEADPIRHGQAHAFLERDEHECATELRLGDPVRVLRESTMRGPWDMVVIADSHLPRLELLDLVLPRLASDALLAIPWALCGGRVADGHRTWEDAPDVEAQRTLNRRVATDPRLTDVALLPVGDGLLLARCR